MAYKKPKPDHSGCIIGVIAVFVIILLISQFISNPNNSVLGVIFALVIVGWIAGALNS